MKKRKPRKLTREQIRECLQRSVDGVKDLRKQLDRMTYFGPNERGLILR